MTSRSVTELVHDVSDPIRVIVNDLLTQIGYRDQIVRDRDQLIHNLNANINANILDRDQTIRNLNANVSLLEARIRDLSVAQSELQSQMRRLTEENNALKTTNSTLLDAMKAGAERELQCTTDRNQVQSANATCIQNVSADKQTITNLQNRINELQTSLVASKNKLDLETNDEKKKIADATAKCSQLLNDCKKEREHRYYVESEVYLTRHWVYRIITLLQYRLIADIQLLSISSNAYDSASKTNLRMNSNGWLNLMYGNDTKSSQLVNFGEQFNTILSQYRTLLDTDYDPDLGSLHIWLYIIMNQKNPVFEPINLTPYTFTDKDILNDFVLTMNTMAHYQDGLVIQQYIREIQAIQDRMAADPSEDDSLNTIKESYQNDFADLVSGSLLPFLEVINPLPTTDTKHNDTKEVELLLSDPIVQLTEKSLNEIGPIQYRTDTDYAKQQRRIGGNRAVCWKPNSIKLKEKHRPAKPKPTVKSKPNVKPVVKSKPNVKPVVKSKPNVNLTKRISNTFGVFA